MNCIYMYTFLRLTHVYVNMGTMCGTQFNSAMDVDNLRCQKAAGMSLQQLDTTTIVAPDETLASDVILLP